MGCCVFLFILVGLFGAFIAALWLLQGVVVAGDLCFIGVASCLLLVWSSIFLCEFTSFCCLVDPSARRFTLRKAMKINS